MTELYREDGYLLEDDFDSFFANEYDEFGDDYGIDREIELLAVEVRDQLGDYARRAW